MLLEVPGLQSTPALGKAVFDYQFEIQQARDAAAKAAPAPATEGQPPPDAKGQRRNLSLNSIAMDMAPKEPSAEPPAKPPENRNAAMAPAETMQPNAPKPPPAPLNIIQKTFRAEALARLQRGIIADCGFAERLVVFWSNHFCISANKGGLARMWAGSFEREAIRPHVLGRFGDMLKAVEQHPAMLFFLDNQQSLGPDSRAGQNRNRGLNENLAREIMELHTLGVGGGYSQDDVTSLARIITGWTYAGRLGQLGAPGTFVFNANAHQPGAQRVMGKIYDGQWRRAGRGGAGGYRAPSLDREIHRRPNSRVTSWPTIRRRRWWRGSPMCSRESDGDLKALATALVDSEEAWKAPLTKMRSPYEFLVASRPAAGADPERSRPLSRRPQRAGPAIMVARRAERFSRYQRGLGGAGRHETAARYLRADRLAPRRQHRSARSAGTRRRRCGVSRRRGEPSSARNRGSRRWRYC